MTTLGPSLAARIALTHGAKAVASRKKNPRNTTIACSTSKQLRDAVASVAVRMNVSNSRIVERALIEYCRKHGVEVESPDAD